MSEKGFFAVSLTVLHQIVEAGGDASDLMTYLVLAKHTTGWGKRKYMDSTAGAKAVSKKTGLTYRRAQVRLTWLQNNGFIQDRDAMDSAPLGAMLPPTHMTEHNTKASKVRWVLLEPDTNRAYLAHSLIEGIGAGKMHPPLARMWDEVQMGPCRIIMDARTDALLLLMHCYSEQSIEDFGGIAPHALCSTWVETEGMEYLEYVDLSVMEVKQGETNADLEFQKRTLPHVPEDDRSERFWNAFINIKRLGFLYEVLQVWQDSPLENVRAELFYPLYILDYHARKSDPYTQREIHELLRDGGHITDCELHHVIEDGIEQQTFRLLRTKGSRECVIGIYRLRFRPSTNDTGRGMEQERLRAEQFCKILAAALPDHRPSYATG